MRFCNFMYHNIFRERWLWFNNINKYFIAERISLDRNVKRLGDWTLKYSSQLQRPINGIVYIPVTIYWMLTHFCTYFPWTLQQSSRLFNQCSTKSKMSNIKSSFRSSDQSYSSIDPRLEIATKTSRHQMFFIIHKLTHFYLFICWITSLASFVVDHINTYFRCF